LPPAFFSALRGTGPLKSFLLDAAALSRCLVVIPVLLLAWAPLLRRLDMVAAHFRSGKIIREEDRLRFQDAFLFFERWRDARVVRIAMLAAVYAIVAPALPHFRSGTLLSWGYSNNGTFSPAGRWYLLVSLPIVIFLAARWIWCQFLWTYFLTRVVQMELHLIPSHPDRAAGLMFVDTCVQGYFPFAFAMGTLVAGGIANHTLFMNMSLLSFKYMPPMVSAFVILLCAGPLWVFFQAMRRARTRGVFEYGALAIALGCQFEQKWLADNSIPGSSALQVPDFSAMTDLCSIVAGVHRMRLVPLELQSVIRLTLWVLGPVLPVVLALVPFDVVMDKTMKLFF
jgi:hypothetical protein